MFLHAVGKERMTKPEKRVRGMLGSNFGLAFQIVTKTSLSLLVNYLLGKSTPNTNNERRLGTSQPLWDSFVSVNNDELNNM